MKNILLIILVITTISCKKETNNNSFKSLNISCSTTVETNEEIELDPIITEKCKLKNYTFISKGFPDNKGRYSWEYELFETKNNKEIKIKNSNIFNDIDELEEIINEEIIKQYKKDSEHPEIKECMTFVKIKKFKIDELRISFDNKNKIEFIAEVFVPSACKNVSLYFASFDVKLISKFLK